MNFWWEWSKAISEFGLSEVYQKANKLVNYPPFFMYVMFFLNKIYHFLGGTFILKNELFFVLIKVPAVLADLLTGYALYYLLYKKWDIELSKVFLCLAFYLFNPGVLYISSYWGQVDSIHTLLMFLCIILLSEKKFLGSWSLFGAAILMKHQAIIIFPILLVYTILNSDLKILPI